MAVPKGLQLLHLQSRVELQQHSASLQTLQHYVVEQ
jgi:hypothetical protein